jgi:TolB-like protein/Flp pilus assembly protein TadD
MEPTLSENPPGKILSPVRPKLSEAEVRAELEKVLASDRFRQAEGLKRFLRYTVEHTLRGEGDQLKEYRIGIEVLDRDPSFDPRLDPAVRMAARRLRAKLQEFYETDGREDPVRIDIPKGGYAAIFSNLPSTDLPSPDKSAGFQKSRTPHRTRIVNWAVIFAALCLGALVFVALEINRGRSFGGASRQIRSIAVLPLQNLSGDPSKEYLADGLTEELLTDLAQVRSLRVISRTSVMTYKGTRKRLPEIARELNVDAVVEGSVMRSGSRIQVTAQLIEAPTDTHLWAQTYQGDLSDLLTLQNQVAQAIVHQVGVKLSSEEQDRLKTVHLASPEAHEAYLLGRYYWNKRNAEGFARAIESFQRAAEKDPQYAPPYAGLADCYVLLAEYTLRPSQEVIPKARDAAARALKLDPTLAEAHASLGAAKVDDWDWKGGEQELSRAIELNPGYATAHQWYAELLSQEGRSDEAITEIKRAQELDPLSLVVNTIEGRILLFAGLIDEAIDQLQKTLELDPDFTLASYNLGKAYLQKGDLKGATAEFQESAKVKVAERAAALAYAYCRAGKTAAARDLMAAYVNQPPVKQPEVRQSEVNQSRVEQRSSTYVSWYGVAIFYAGLGQNDQAITSLEKAYVQHDSRLRDVKEDAFFESLHSDPRFARLVQSVGL